MKKIKGLLLIVFLFFACDFVVERVMKHGVDEMYGLNQDAQDTGFFRFPLPVHTGS